MIEIFSNHNWQFIVLFSHHKDDFDFPDLKMNEIKKPINRGRWTKEEDGKLRKLVEIYGERWDVIGSHYTDRADVQCQHRWNKVVNPNIVKG